MPQVTQNGASVDFQTGPFYDYCKMREGYKLFVYPDIDGNATVGIGHLVTDGTAMGTVVTEAQVQQYFESDYAGLSIEQYVTESNYTLNQMLCIGHFIWLHGGGAYAQSDYRQNWLTNKYPNEADQQAYLQGNWDTADSRKQAVNARDCSVAYMATDWAPGIADQIAWTLDDNFPTISGWCQTNQLLCSLVLLFIIGLLFWLLVTKWK